MGLMVERQRKPKRSKSEFGWVLGELMEKYQVESRSRLSEMLEDPPHYSISQPMISFYMNDRYPPTAEFVIRVMKRLNLADADKRKLAEAWAATRDEGELEMLSLLWNYAKGNISDQDVEDLRAYEEKRAAEDGRTDGDGSAPNGR